MKFRNCVRVILLNDINEVLLLYADDPSATGKDGTYRGPFWFLVGGEIEANETIEDAARREIHEETGLSSDAIRLGPVVGWGHLDLHLQGNLTRLRQNFIVARTSNRDVSLENAMPYERAVIKKLAWFSHSDILSSKENIYPLSLPRILPAIIADEYPSSLAEINLDEF